MNGLRDALKNRVREARLEGTWLDSLTVAVSENKRLEPLLADHVAQLERALVPLLAGPESQEPA